MTTFRRFPEPAPPSKPVTLPPGLDMGLLKAEDLLLDLEREATRLRAASAARASGDRAP